MNRRTALKSLAGFAGFLASLSVIGKVFALAQDIAGDSCKLHEFDRQSKSVGVSKIVGSKLFVYVRSRHPLQKCDWIGYDENGEPVPVKSTYDAFGIVAAVSNNDCRRGIVRYFCGPFGEPWDRRMTPPPCD